MRFARDQSVVRQPRLGSDRPVRSPRRCGMREALHVKLRKRSGALVAAGIAAAMMLSACGGSDNGGGGSSAQATGGTFSMYIREPQNPLGPRNTPQDQGKQGGSLPGAGPRHYDGEG